MLASGLDLAAMPTSSSPDRTKVLVLYTELAPYVLACLNAWVEAHPVEVHLVRWPVNQEAPFDLRFHANVHVHERTGFDDAGLLSLAERIAPAMVMASGWVDKGYLKVCRTLKARGVRTVMTFDTAWRGGAKQWAHVLLARTWLHRTFSHAWVTGSAQAKYARLLGFAAKTIRTGFYSADTAHFLSIGGVLLETRTVAWPHRFLCVARYISTKGQQLLCDAFAELCDENAAGDWELWLAGTGEQFKQVASSVSGKHARIHHLGFKQVNEMDAVLNDVGSFVLPSTYEPWGGVVHEHACAGLPMLLSSAVGAAERFLMEGENGHRFRAGDKQTLKAAMRKIIVSTDDELRTMGQRSRALGGAWSPQAWSTTAHELLQGA